eukprot:gnl/TRDRNA2_/TRDRNA2_146499_c0_seq2.p2 gnl/TRDRNA2_/TRDRNA2_146499_c0~~gnl/TRDRNA2_/TRDRNA2_146499_c0_seq2.p2  ORF type:complete len:148 (-),score=37.29 gnl/TRDRNA2_/TRDRNA2_146499_c0_seq2:176-619(-)
MRRSLFLAAEKTEGDNSREMDDVDDKHEESPSGIFRATNFAFEELEEDFTTAAGSKCRVALLKVCKPQLPIFEDDDGDLVLPREKPDAEAGALELGESSAASGLVGTCIQLCRLTSSDIDRVGLQLWAGALVLSDFLLARPEIVSRP